MHDLAYKDMNPEAEFRVNDDGVLRTVAIKYRSADGEPFMKWLEPFSEHIRSEFYMTPIQLGEPTVVKNESEKTSA